MKLLNFTYYYSISPVANTDCCFHSSYTNGTIKDSKHSQVKDIVRLGRHSQAWFDPHIGEDTPTLQVVIPLSYLCEALVLQS